VKRSFQVSFANSLLSFRTDVNVLVNNSGNNWGESYDKYPDAAWNRVLGLNLQRVFTLTQKLTPLMLKSLPSGNTEGPWEDPAVSVTFVD
jgi:NADP-dependent 3-hydroxy acid dehydrogenase YdfG